MKKFSTKVVDVTQLPIAMHFEKQNVYQIKDYALILHPIKIFIKNKRRFISISYP